LLKFAENLLPSPNAERAAALVSGPSAIVVLACLPRCQYRAPAVRGMLRLWACLVDPDATFSPCAKKLRVRCNWHSEGVVEKEERDAFWLS